MATEVRSIYLHFLDRELAESVQRQVTSDDSEIALKLLSALSGAALNCGVSLLFESPAITSSKSLHRLTQLLLDSGRLSLLSSHPTIPEFLESRSDLYAHDRLRYPMYFGTPMTFAERVSIIPKSSSATHSLVKSLAEWGNDRETVSERDLDAKNVVLESLSRREDRAVTAAIFSAASAKSTHPESAIRIVRRQISLDYTRHFMGTFKSDIATGITGLGFFDRLSVAFPMFDIAILLLIAKIVGLSGFIRDSWELHRDFWEKFYYDGTSEHDFIAFVHQMDILLAAFGIMYRGNSIGNIDQFRIYITQALRKIGGYFSFDDVRVENGLFEIVHSRLQDVVVRLTNNRDFSSSIEIARSEQTMKESFDFLLMVATDIERLCVFEKVAELGNKVTPYFGGGRGYFDLGYISGKRVALVKVEMGSTSVGGSTTTSMRIIEQLKPRYIIMLGIAFGVDEKKQSVGDVLIGRQLLSYEQERVGTREDGTRQLTIRGDRSSASPVLVSLLQTTVGVWNEAPVEVGLILSGEKLVDNLDFREQLQSIAGGEAIGGEMEGVGLMVAASESSTPWVVVKAICDWADGKKAVDKKQRQTLAAQNAVSFVFRALKIAIDDREVR